MRSAAAKRVLEIIDKKEKVTQEEMFELWVRSLLRLARRSC